MWEDSKLNCSILLDDNNNNNFLRRITVIVLAGERYTGNTRSPNFERHVRFLIICRQ